MSYDKQERMSALEESDEVFYAKMQKGLDDVRNGRITPLDDVYAELSKAISELKNGTPVKECCENTKPVWQSVTRAGCLGVGFLWVIWRKL